MTTLNSTTLVQQAIDRLTDSNPDCEFGLILIGSVARRVETLRSDLDLLVISELALTVPELPEKLHIQSISESDFLEKLKAGDDFVAWCVRYGIPVVNSNVWTRIIESSSTNTWPDWHHKVRHAARRLLLAWSLLETGDEDAASEELLYSASHLSRAILLKGNVFPLSRPEMIAQLEEIGYPKLAQLLKELLFADSGPSIRLRRVALYLKRVLCWLDRDTYADVALAYSRAKSSKRPEGLKTVSK